MANPEREQQGVPEGIVERHRDLEIPRELEQAGVVPTQQAPAAQVVADDQGDDQGQVVIAPADQHVTVEIPASKEHLEGWSKGSVTESITWFAHFWLRMVKKATHFGKRVVNKG